MAVPLHSLRAVVRVEVLARRVAELEQAALAAEPEGPAVVVEVEFWLRGRIDAHPAHGIDRKWGGQIAGGGVHGRVPRGSVWRSVGPVLPRSIRLDDAQGSRACHVPALEAFGGA